MSSTGKLYLVSVGVGDQDNMTLRALKTIESADIIFASPQNQERLANLLADKEINDCGHGLFTSLARRKQANDEVDALEQHIRELIRGHIAAAKTVAILDSGDPTLYGPHIGYLQEFKDLNPVIIPGLSSFTIANALLKRGLTDSKLSESVILTTAKTSREGYDGTDTLDKLAATQASLVFFTMRLDLAEVVEQLQQHYSADTPIAIVLHAGHAEKEAIIEATLATIVDVTGEEKLPFEHMIYVGDFLQEGGYK